MRQNREDYLRTIYWLYENNNGVVKSIDISNYLGLSKPAVSEMLKKLKRNKYIKMVPYSDIELTAKGFRLAKKLTYKHRVSEMFLKEILHLEDKYIHQEAHKLEHAFSDKVIKKLSKFLGNPKYCPHGNLIPKLEK